MIRLLILGAVLAASHLWAQPTITTLNPVLVQADSAGFNLTVTGTLYNPCTKIRWDGVEQQTTFVNTTTLTAAIPSSLLTTPRAVAVTALAYANTSPPCGNPGLSSTPRDFFVTARPLDWETAATLPQGAVGVGYEGLLLAVFGVSPLTYSIVPGSALPPGLTLSTAGLITGIPTQAGAFTFTARATSNCPVQTGFCAPDSITRLFTLVVTGPALSITTLTLPSAVACSTYSVTLAAAGGAGGYVWSSTTLPAGLSINAQTGVLSGVVTSPGTPQFSITVRDALNVTASRVFILQVGASTLGITTSSLPGASVGTPYSAGLAASGGIGPYTFAATSDVVPGLTTSTAGAIGGTPQQSGTFNTTYRVTDANSCIALRSIPIQVQGSPLSITPQQLPNGFTGEPYSAQLAATGGTGQRTWLVSSGALPSGLALGSTTGLISGTPLAAGTSQFEVRVTDAANATATRSFSIVIVAPLSITTTALPSAAACGVYSTTLAVSGGLAPFTWSATGLPAGITINAQTGVISGAPAAAGVFNVSVSVRDQVNELPATRNFTLTFTAPSLAIATATLPPATLSNFYSTTLSATGGVAPFTFALAANGVPGLTVAPAGTLSGIPTQSGLFESTYRVTDAQSCTATRALPLQVSGSPLSILTSALPQARVGQPYFFQMIATGGGANRTWTISSGLPSGLLLDAASGILSGTPLVAGDFVLQVNLSDGSSTPTSRLLNLNVSTALSIVTEFLPAAAQGQPYSFTLLATGGAQPLRFSAPDLPAGLAIDTAGNILGTPLVQGTFQVNFQVSDAQGQFAARLLSLTVNPELRILSDGLAIGQIGAGYNQTLSVTGGRPPYTIQIVSPPSLPRGLNLDPVSGQISGTPSEAGDFNLVFRVSDQTGRQVEKILRLTIRASFFIQTESLPPASLNEPYSAPIEATGGRAPLRWSIENAVPSGLSLNPSTGALGGTPSTGGVFTLNVLAVDAAGLEARKSFTLVVRAQLQISPSTLAPGEVGVEYRQGITVTGTQTAASLLVSAGALPDGLRLEGLDLAANILGTPLRAGAFDFSLRATDATGIATIQNYTIRVAERLSISTGALPSANSGSPFRATLAATGGEAPFNWSVSSGSLPAGLQLGAQSGVIDGSPSADGLFDFTVQVRDSDGRQASRALQLRVLPVLTVAPAALPAGAVGVPYSQRLTADRATGAVTFTVTQGSLPAGLTLNGSTGAIGGVPRAAATSNFTIGVSDAAGASGSRALSIVVAPLPVPSVVISPDAVTAAQQQPIAITLGSALPADIDGLVRLSFVSEDGGPADPALRLSSPDGLTAAFRVPAGQTQAAFPAALSLQTGTVAGTITLTLELTANGVPVTPSPAPVRVIRIPRAAPVIDSVVARRSGNTVTVEIVAFATGREVASAEFQFTSSGGLTQNSFTVQTTAAVSAWYQDPRSREFGSLFRLAMPFTITPDASLLTQVSVTLVNSAGRSQSRQANIQ